jgi:hypothetical protein
MFDPPDDMPPNWEMHFSDEGIPYFWNRETGDSQWYAPSSDQQANNHENADQYPKSEPKTEEKTSNFEKFKRKTVKIFSKRSGNDVDDLKKSSSNEVTTQSSSLEGNPAKTRTLFGRAKSLTSRKSAVEVPKVETEIIEASQEQPKILLPGMMVSKFLQLSSFIRRSISCSTRET